MPSTLNEAESLKSQKCQSFYSLFRNNHTQIIIILITLIPSLIMLSSAFICIQLFQSTSLKMIEDFADELYIDQINSSKLQNIALVFQLNQQVQKIAWQMNMLNEFLGSVLLGDVIKNNNHVPAIHNIDRSYYNDEDPIVLAMFRKNPVLTSVWHHVNKTRLNELDQRQMDQISDGSRLDSIWKAIQFDNKNRNKMWLKIKDIFQAHEYDGLIYMTSINTTYTTYPIPQGCPYLGTYRLDIRCRYYYPPTMSNISTMLFDPQIFYTEGNPILASPFCQRRLRYKIKDPDSESEKYSIICITLDLSIIPEYFKNFGENSKYQLFLDPRKLTVVYHSLLPLQRTQIASVQDFETQYLQDQNEANKFLDHISQMSQYTLESKDQVIHSGFNQQNAYQKTFEYNRNGTNCFVIENLITMIDKVPRYEFLKSKNRSQKYQLKNAFLFLDVLSKEKMTQYSSDLQTKIKSYNYYFTYSSWGIALLLLWVELYYSINLGRNLMHPIIHLTSILKQIRIQNQKQQDQNNYSFPQSFTVQSDHSNENIIEIDEHIDADFDGVCFSSDTQILLNSFQNLFKILRFTTQNLYSENESQSLLNLNIQIQYFQQLGNYRALGVCYNNIGVIHLNFERYKEAIENFQKAIIYAKYELNMYSHDCEGIEITDNINRLTRNLRSTLFSNNSQLEAPIMGQTTRISNRSKIKSNFNNQSSYNENNNNNNNNNDQSLLTQQSQEREQLYWNLFYRNENYMKAISLFLDKIKIDLWDIFLDYALENTCISQLFLPPSNKREMMNYYMILIGYYKQNLINESKNIFEKYIHLYTKDIEIKNLSRQNQLNENKIFLSPPNNNNILQGQPLSNRSSFNYDYQYQQNYLNLNNQSNLNDNYFSHILLSPIQKIKQNPTIKLISQEQQKYQEFNSLDNIKFTRQSLQRNQNFRGILDTNQSFQQYEDESGKKISYLNFNKQVLEEQAIYNLKINSRIQLKQLYKNPQNSNRQTISNRTKATKEQIQLQQKRKRNKCYFQVRKIEKSDKLTHYEFKSDILFFYYAQLQAQFQIKQENYYIAAQMLTNALDQCEYYLPHLKKNALSLLLTIFKKQKIDSFDLKQMKHKYKKLTNSNFHACVISACQNIQKQKRAYAISNDLINELLFRENDSYGMIQYSFEDNYYILSMGLTTIKTMKSSPLYFQNILKSLYGQDQLREKQNRQTQYSSVYKEEGSKQYINLSQNKDRNKFQEDLIIDSPATLKDNSFYNNTDFRQASNFKPQNKSKSQQIIKLSSNKSIQLVQNDHPLYSQPSNRQIIDENQEYNNTNKPVQKKKNKMLTKIPSIQNDIQIDSSQSLSILSSLESIDDTERVTYNKIPYNLKYKNQNKNSLNNLNSQNIDLKTENHIEKCIPKKNQQNMTLSKSAGNANQLIYSQINKHGKTNTKNNLSATPEKIFNFEQNTNLIPLQRENSKQQIEKDILQNYQQAKISKIEELQIQLSPQQNIQFTKRQSSLSQNIIEYSNLASSSNFLSKQRINLFNKQESPSFSPMITNNFSKQTIQQIDNSPNYLLNQQSSQTQFSKINIEQQILTLNTDQFSPLINKKISEKNQQFFKQLSQEDLEIIRLNKQDSKTPKKNDQKISSEDRYQSQQQLPQTGQRNNEQYFSFLQKDLKLEEQKILQPSNDQIGSFSQFLNENVQQIDNKSQIQNPQNTNNIIDIQAQKLTIFGNIQNKIDNINNYYENQNYQDHPLQNQKNPFPVFQLKQSQDDNFNKDLSEKNTFQKINDKYYNQQQMTLSPNIKKKDPTKREMLSPRILNTSLNKNMNGEEIIKYPDDSQQIFTSEQIFHFGIQAALKQFILNTDEKITCYLSNKKNNDRKNRMEYKRFSKQNQTFLIYITDQYLKLNNKFVLNKLCNLLTNLGIELLVLSMNHGHSLEGQASLNKLFEQEMCVIKFFTSEQKMLQYIYNNREHIKNYNIPMTFEHF